MTQDGTSIGDGQIREYGNLFDTMGYGSVGSYAFGAYEKYFLDWLPESAIQTVTSNGVYRLFPLDAEKLSEGESHGLRIAKDSQRDYWVEMRRAGDPQLKSGVLLTWSPWWQSLGGTAVLNCNPQSYGQATLQTGQAFYDLDRGLKIVPVKFIESPAQAVDIEVRQVDFIALELSSSGAPLRASTRMAEVPRLNAQSGQVTIEQSGSYFVWVQTPNRSPYSDAVQLTILDGDSRIGTVTSSSPGDVSPWNGVNRVSGSGSRPIGALGFPLAAGVHSIQVQAADGTAENVRLLITNDPATNLPPVFSRIEDQAMSTGSTLTVPFFVSAVGQAASSLTVEAISETPDLIPDANITLDGEAFDWTVTISSSLTRTGTGSIRLKVRDTTGHLSSARFSVLITGIVQGLVDSAEPGATIQFPAGTSYGNIVINKDLTLEAAAVNESVLDGQNTGVTLTVATNCTVTLKGMIIQNSHGAGVRNFGNLTLESSTVQQNQGSGIYNRGTLVLHQVKLQGNTSGQGGGLDNYGAAELHDCSIGNNKTVNGAGGLINRKAGTMSCDNCSIARNRSQDGNGGGLQNFGNLTLRNCTIANNMATQTETGHSHVTAGGIYNSGRLVLQNSTVCRNQSEWEGGGVDNHADASLANSLIAGNLSLMSSSADFNGSLVSLGHNLIQNPEGCTISGEVAGNLLGQDPLLGVLADHGGITETVDLMHGSPAIDAGTCTSCTCHGCARRRPSDRRGV